MVSEMIRPSVVTFLDMMLRERDRVLRFEEVQVKPGSFLVDKKMCESRVKEKTEALVVAIRKAGTGEYDFNPARDAVIQADDTLILIGSPEMVQKLEKLASGT